LCLIYRARATKTAGYEVFEGSGRGGAESLRGGIRKEG
jgi:hypothetical protein